jgi:hypothetical protein
MSVPVDRLCVVVTPRERDVDPALASALRTNGIALWHWVLGAPGAAAMHLPETFDALLVLGLPPEFALPAELAQRLNDALRRAWLHGAAIGLYGGASALLDAAAIATPGAPLEVAGLLTDEVLPSPDAMAEFVDAVRGVPYGDRAHG